VKLKTFGPGVTKGVPTYVGIDQSYSGFGMCFLGEDGSYLATVRSFANTGVERLVDVQSHILRSTIDAFSPSENLKDIAMEGYAYGSQMANMAGELGATVKLTVYTAYNVHPLIVPPTTLKKYVTGKGNGVKKSQMMLSVYKKWGVELLDDNAADAYALAKIASKHAETEYEKDVLKLLSDPKHREKTNEQNPGI
jgi:Holliday junction resolvasome RuvABC endonuclease subunit